MGATEFDKPLDNDFATINTNLGSPTSASGVTGADAFSKINTVNTNLGSPTSASSVTGADAFTKINTLNSKCNPERGNLTESLVSSDTSIMSLLPGTYQNILGNSIMPYLPTGYGTLIVNDSGESYKSFFYVSTGDVAWYRICHKVNNTWYGSWQELALNSNLAKIEGSTVSFWSTLSTQKYQGNYFAQVYGNFKGKTLTLTGALVYNGSSSYNILSTTSITQLNDFCVNISTTSESIGGALFYVTFSVS